MLDGFNTNNVLSSPSEQLSIYKKFASEKLTVRDLLVGEGMDLFEDFNKNVICMYYHNHSSKSEYLLLFLCSYIDRNFTIWHVQA